MFRSNKRHLQTQMLTTIHVLPAKQAKRLEDSWAGAFYRDFFSLLDERPFAALYSDTDSRPNVPVNVLVGLEALKSGFDWSDEEMHDAFCFDLQVRYALGYRNLGEGEFSLRTVYNFRQRLSHHMQRTGENLIERSFEQVTDEQITSYQLKTGKARMDSAQIASNIRNMSRLQLLVEVIQRVHRMLSEPDRALYAESFAPYTQGGSGQYVYRVKGKDGAEHMERIGQLMSRLLSQLAASYGEHTTYQILQRVFTEHFILEQERLRLKTSKELSSHSLQSPDDIEATFRNKDGRYYKGYVANVTETCDPHNPLQLITKVQTKPNITNDDDMLIEALPSLEQRLGLDEIYTDGGFNSPESYQALRDKGVNHVQTAIGGAHFHKWLGLDTFEISTSDEGLPIEVTCPQGQRVRVEAGKGKERYLARFDTHTCSSCPFQERCRTSKLQAKPLRTLYFDHHDAEIARRRRRIAQDRQKGCNLRAAIESTIASLKCPFNFGQLPVRGLFRVSMVLLGSAAMANVRRIHRYLCRKGAAIKAVTRARAVRRAQHTSAIIRCCCFLSHSIPLPKTNLLKSRVRA